MATITKARLKTKKLLPASDTHTKETEQEPVLEIKSGKSKKPIEIEESEAIIGVEEKIEEDPLVAPVEEDDSADEISLDGEEINPFGDRWEE
ncbi:MAG: hypothetical protein A3C79_02875 [Candidatus Taylorbacteria bacterium RIFCSPHIGHO2_02_FULL_45_28]|uniref:Uncharacterized protein n=1 Tax=Candidatus Taylorbacteria bacterium RIFCSPHIGHO2_12_FULL_45_16 TaxID=1802315 RepID=A0A1G2N118_9BACT|nr:MAG: hypothetical protein A2830_00595 [Candidatus Taylorbacteria bacterium RIFCSPHIGHO2_01_FULL_44_110]OHA24905.1 MAG: hypothetical protein A3C79_02875 [Candidatus Taylorbacteria bacterium RIFCSPHIGHO2_02_FULL_45_28]OHA29723.1 MAG: hypothetical protein A3F51_03290 [Candidatus Taylorbacteria bacterium RIFCSPHIGHO2_12_FULL_45_16]OHA32667.1 MAG: hypothetical protein A3A23_00160 [Candidatus Taylorbacteria bacterium RIFCSPLOWO2_01_FULL_45_59]OHA38822.1 MAG: hypothetical protein A3I98_01600 [Candi